MTMQNIKTLLGVSIATILAYFEPIQNILLSISMLFVLNFIFGLVAGIVAQKEYFSFRKAFTCISEASVFLLILASTFFIGDHLGIKNGALQAISTIAYTLLYFYSVNIFKNLHQLLPASRTITFLHNLISIEMLNKLPILNINTKQV